MVLADAGQAVGTVILLLISFAAEWLSSVASVCRHLCSGDFRSLSKGPAFSASMTMLIPDDQRDRANAIQQLTSPAAGVIAPIFAGVLYARDRA